MIAQYLKSRLEIWGANYIDNPNIRDEKDKNARVVQIEPSGTQYFYMVEVIDEEDLDEEGFFGG